MLTTEECKRIGRIMIEHAPKTQEKALNIVNQISMLPDAVSCNLDAVYDHLLNVIANPRSIDD